MKKIDEKSMILLEGGTDELGCTGIILLGVAASFVTFGFGLLVAGAGLGICASEIRSE
jgi:hypothetical protein